ncbi:hypothetical protein J6590_000493 [Homalodisca vitripennis]|nr:hypothetical protein J6590_000493 [Homalodisca vitripennis]
MDSRCLYIKILSYSDVFEKLFLQQTKLSSVLFQGFLLKRSYTETQRLIKEAFVFPVDRVFNQKEELTKFSATSEVFADISTSVEATGRKGSLTNPHLPAFLLLKEDPTSAKKSTRIFLLFEGSYNLKSFCGFFILLSSTPKSAPRGFQESLTRHYFLQPSAINRQLRLLVRRCGAESWCNDHGSGDEVDDRYTMSRWSGRHRHRGEDTLNTPSGLFLSQH